jgi:tryptophan halogenase
MSAPREPLRRVVIVGGGQVAVLAAIALRRALPVCQVLVIGQQPSPAAFADWSPTALPFTNKLHDRLGIAESAIVLKAGGSYRLVTRYPGWGGQGQTGTLSHGEMLDPALKTAFARDWGGGRKLGGDARQVGSLAEVLADAGRFAPPPPDEPTPISDVDYALRWNPAAYRELLIEAAQALQVQYLEGAIAGVELDAADGFATIELAGQGRIEADLFLDCSGPEARLIASHPAFAMVDWSASLPTRTVYLARPGAPMVALEDRIALTEIGWMAQVAGRDGLYTALGTGAGVDRTAALAALGGQASAAIALAPGRVAAPWIGNVIALGDAAARCEPLGPLHLDLAHRQLELLLEMLPGRALEPLERAEYNRRSVLMMEGVHELLALHFAAPAAQRLFGTRQLPGRVAEVIDQFERRGRIPFREEAPLLAQEQFALLVALGFKPGLPPAAVASNTAAEDRARAEFAAAAQAALAFAPPYGQWLTSVLQSNRAPAG